MAEGTKKNVDNGQEKLIPLMNKLQDAFTILGTQEGIDLPQICVVGGQSSGKSSVLENVVGRSFLPRGSGIVTRRPLVLQLVHVQQGDSEYGEFLHDPGNKYYDYEEIRKEIDRDTARICGENKGLSTKPINLKVYSPDVLDLTLIDLPGTTRVAVGDQPDDIGEQIREMVLSYITRPSTIILAVTAANTDIANSDALQLAKKVDPEGNRTVGVLTKLDLMDRGTDAGSTLRGEVFKLKLGFVGVVNRSQQDIMERKSLQEARASEVKFFERHAAYRNMSDRMGTSFLVRLLSKLLVSKIKEELPKIASQIHRLVATKKQELVDLGGETGRLGDIAGQRRFLTEALVGFTNRLQRLIKGGAEPFIATPNGNMSVTRNQSAFSSAASGGKTEIKGGARLEYIFANMFTAAIDETAEGLERLSSEEIATTMKNVSGLGGGLFIPQDAFVALLRKWIQAMEAPSLQCVQLVYDELVQIVGEASNTTPELENFPNLKDRIVNVVNAHIGALVAEVKKMTSVLIAMEQSRLNLEHPDFLPNQSLGGIAAITRQVEEELMRSEGRSPAQKALLPGSGATADPDAGVTSILLEGNVLKKTTGAKLFGQWASRYVEIHDSDTTLRWFKSKGSSEMGRMKLRGARALDASQQTGKQSAINVVSAEGSEIMIAFEGSNGNALKGEWLQCIFTLAMGMNGGGIIPNKRGSVARKDPPPIPQRMSVSLTAQRSASPRKESVQLVDDDFRDGGILSGAPSNIRQSSVSRKGLVQTEILRRLLRSYFSIVRKTTQDLVPKAITLMLVDKSINEVGVELMAQLYKDDLLDDLVSESPEIKTKREACLKTLETLSEVDKAMSDIRIQASTC